MHEKIIFEQALNEHIHAIHRMEQAKATSNDADALWYAAKQHRKTEADLKLAFDRYVQSLAASVMDEGPPAS